MSGKQQQHKGKKPSWRFLQYLEAADALLQDKNELRRLGLTEEELNGYEEFFFHCYYPQQEMV